MRYIYPSTLVFLCSLLFGQFESDIEYTQYVNPFIGTKKMGHTFPGTVVPYGMVQLCQGSDAINYFFGSN